MEQITTELVRTQRPYKFIGEWGFHHSFKYFTNRGFISGLIIFYLRPHTRWMDVSGSRVGLYKGELLGLKTGPGSYRLIGEMRVSLIPLVVVNRLMVEITG